jgi:hypothetical protein
MPTDQAQPIVAFHPVLNRHVVMPIGNLAVFDGWIETDIDPTALDPFELNELLAIPAEQGQPTDLPAVPGDPTVATSDETKE